MSEFFQFFELLLIISAEKMGKDSKDSLERPRFIA